MKTFKVIGAAYWASYFINGDASGLEEREITLAHEWAARELGPSDHIVDCGEPYFSWHYTLHTGDAASQGGDVCEYTIVKW